MVVIVLAWTRPVQAQDASAAGQRFMAVSQAVQRATPVRPNLHPVSHAELVGLVMVAQSAGTRPMQEVEPALRWMSGLMDQEVTLGRDSNRFAQLVGTLMLAWGVSDDSADVIVRRYNRMLRVVRGEQPQWPAGGVEVQWAAAVATLAASLPGCDEKLAVKHYRFASFHPLRPALTRPQSEGYARGPACWTLAACARQTSVEEVSHSWMELRHGLERLINADTSTVPFEEAIAGLLSAWSVSNGEEKPVVEAGEVALNVVQRAGVKPWTLPFLRSWGPLTTAILIRGDSRAATADFDAIDQFLQSQPLGLPRQGEAYQSLLGLMTVSQALASRAGK
jgi:hypothetical protein